MVVDNGIDPPKKDQNFHWSDLIIIIVSLNYKSFPVIRKPFLVTVVLGIWYYQVDTYAVLFFARINLSLLQQSNALKSFHITVTAL